MVSFLPPPVKKALSAKDGAPKWALEVMDAHKRRMQRWYKPGVPFPVGQRQIFLPNFQITMLRKPKQSPYFATFQVPLNFNKLDMRDYLFNAYDVDIRAVHTQIKELRIRSNDQSSRGLRPGRRRMYRPKSEKRMTVELVKPFVWPEAPKGEELEQWDHKRAKNIARMQVRQTPGPQGKDEITSERRKTLREKAQRLLDGKDQWKQIDPSSVAQGQTMELPLR